MENVINQILQIDKNACERLEQAKQEKSKILSEAKLEEIRIREADIKRADDRVEKIDEYEKSIADEKIAYIEAEKLKQMAALQGIYDENHLQWEREIFARIVGE